jgi:hypothetical protein
MSEAPDATPEEEPAEVVPPKTGAEAWKERRALILDRNRAARDRGKGHSDREDNRVADQRRANAGREAAQLQSMNAHLTKKRPRG